MRHGFGHPGDAIARLVRYLEQHPELMEKLERAGCAKPVVGLVVPTGYVFNTDGTSMEATPRIKAHNVALKARAVKKAFMSAWDYSSSSLRIEATSSGESFRSFLSSNEATSLPGEPSKKVRSSFFSAVSRAFSGAMAGS